jgi:hypothetical protein
VSAGCSVEEEKEVMAGLRPDQYWKGVWEVEERESHIELTPDHAVIDAFCLVKYLGEEPAEDVRIVIRSPLAYRLIEDDLAADYGTVKPGQELEYHLYHEDPSWRKKVPVGVFEVKLVDDFFVNAYVDISWKYGEEKYNIHFYDWGHAYH